MLGRAVLVQRRAFGAACSGAGRMLSSFSLWPLGGDSFAFAASTYTRSLEGPQLVRKTRKSSIQTGESELTPHVTSRGISESPLSPPIPPTMRSSPSPHGRSAFFDLETSRTGRPDFTAIAPGGRGASHVCNGNEEQGTNQGLLGVVGGHPNLENLSGS